MGSKSSPPPSADDQPQEADDIATAQQARPVIFSRGTRQFAGYWLTDALDQLSVQSPDDKPSKK